VKQVRIVARDPDIDISVPMGNESAKPVGGLGGWKEVERQDDLSVSDWDGQPLLREDVALLLDEYPGGSVQREWNTIKKLGRDPNGDEKVPPVFRVYGPLDYSGKAFVLPEDGIEILDGEIKPIKRHDGDWQRIEFILHLMEYRRPDTIQVRRKKKSRSRMGVGPGHPLTYTTVAGDTLVKIAAKVFGDWKRWKEIGDKNGIADPHRVLPAGRGLAL
jgi:hypothetical protein